MRTREQIKETERIVTERAERGEINDGSSVIQNALILETLLDIRDLLASPTDE